MPFSRFTASSMSSQTVTSVAVKHAMRVVELKPKSSAAWNNLGTAYHSLQQYDAAKVAWDNALELEPTRTAYTNRGLQYYYDGRYADAAEMQLKATELAPNDHRARGRLAESYRAMGVNEDIQKETYAIAIDLARSNLEINDQDWPTRAMLATYYVYSGRQDDALRADRRGLEYFQTQSGSTALRCAGVQCDGR